uniref:Secreted protein n=1 Tax=Achlya hypogyna TaxID=1202772 RepID=A0A0A7CPG0_ACHHY|nr:secreted protein [Achlya hypogyna]
MRTGFIALCVLATTVTAAPNTTAAHNESGVVENVFPRDQWGIRRVNVVDNKIVDRYDAYLSLWNGIVHTESWGGLGGKARVMMSSYAYDGSDMLRHVWDNQCLDAYLVPGDNYPRLHGYACDRNNDNQRWYFLGV